MTLVAIVTLLAGIVIGFVAQRSRMCFIGGIRDYIFVRDTFLLKGIFAFGFSAWFGFSAAHLLESASDVGYMAIESVSYWQTVIGGFGVGVLSVFANGCPLRQHVMAAQGNISAIAYLVGFLMGALIFYKLVFNFVLGL